MTKDLKEAQKGTILAKINEIFESGVFEGEPTTSSAEEKVIGELADYEKAIFSRKYQLVKELENLKEKITPANIFEMIEKIEELKQEFEIMENIFWASLRRRLSTDFGSIGIRAGWKVVGKDPKSDSVFLGGLLNLGEILSIVIGPDGHNCSICPKYDECDLPIKKTRD